jgi:protein phosphatase
MDSLLNFASLSFVGRRKNNEDSKFPDEIPSESKITLFAVADGMGGANAGEVASLLAIKTISSFLEEQLNPEISYTDDDIKAILKKGFQKIQVGIADTVKDNPAYTGMGTTLVLLLHFNCKWFGANLGDSRLYYINENKVKQLTKDHTLLQEYLDSHDQPPDEEWLNKYSSYLVKVLDGTECIPDVFVVEEEFKNSDDSCFLLCSDGLLPGKGIGGELPYASIIHNSKDIQESAEQLVCQAYHRGSTDNITVILIETKGFKHSPSRDKKYIFPPDPQPQQFKHIPGRRKSSLLFFVIISGLILCFLGILYLTLPDRSMSHGVSSDRIKISPSLTLKNTPSHSNNLVNNSSPWEPFKDDWYSMPLDIKSYLMWNTYSGKSDVSMYKILIFDNKSLIDSASVDQRASSYPLNKFEHLKPDLKKKYLFILKARLSNDQTAEKSIYFYYK